METSEAKVILAGSFTPIEIKRKSVMEVELNKEMYDAILPEVNSIGTLWGAKINLNEDISAPNVKITKTT